MHNFRQLQIWQKSMEIAKSVLTITKSFPKYERYGITSQVNRCAISIPSNIAEGSSRKSKKDFSRFLSISLGSSFELETQLLLCIEMGYITHQDVQNKLTEITEVQKMLSGLIQKFDSEKD